MPKRVFAVLGFSAFASTLLASRMGPELSQTLAVFAGVLAFCGVVAAVFARWTARALAGKGKAFLPWAVGSAMAFAAVSVVLGLYCRAWHIQVEPVEFLDGGQAAAQLRILDFPEERYHRYYYPAKVVKINGIDAGGIPIRLSCQEPLYCQPYDQVQVQVVFYQFQDNGEWFSTRGAQLAAGNLLGAYTTGGVEKRTQEQIYWPGRIAALARSRVGRGIARYLPEEEAGLIRAVLLGDRSGISESTSSGFTRIGAAHLMAVSGLHISVLAAFVVLLVRRIPFGRWGRFLLCGAALLCYLCLIGFPASALRSSQMFFLTLLAQTAGHRGDSRNALGFALLVICVIYPFAGGDLGFVLSATSTLGIILLYRPVMDACTCLFRRLPQWNRLLRPVWAAVSVTISANAFSLPVQLEAFGGISLMLIPANLLLVPLISGMLYCTVPLAVFAPFPETESLARVCGFCAGWMARLVLWVEKALASLPGTFFWFDSLWLAALGGMALWGIVLLLKPIRRKGAVLALGILVIVEGTAGIDSNTRRDVLTIAMAGSEESVCVLVMKNDRAAALSLGGYRSGMAEQLLAREHISAIDSILLPERTPQAREMLTDLADSCPVGRLILPEGAYVWKSMKKLNVTVEFAPLGESWELLPGVWVQLDPEEERLFVWSDGRELELRLGERCGLYLSLPGESVQVQEMAVLFRAEDMPEWELFQGESPGNFIVLGEQESLFLRIGPDELTGYELYG